VTPLGFTPNHPPPLAAIRFTSDVAVPALLLKPDTERGESGDDVRTPLLGDTSALYKLVPVSPAGAVATSELTAPEVDDGRARGGGECNALGTISGEVTAATRASGEVERARTAARRASCCNRACRAAECGHVSEKK